MHENVNVDKSAKSRNGFCETSCQQLRPRSEEMGLNCTTARSAIAGDNGSTAKAKIKEERGLRHTFLMCFCVFVKFAFGRQLTNCTVRIENQPQRMPPGGEDTS